MNFDYTYISFRGLLVFEPLIIVSNLIMLVCALYYSYKLYSIRNAYSFFNALCILMIGISGIFGAIAHSVHFQMGDVFFRTVFFLMNTFSLVSILFWFYATFLYLRSGKKISTTVWIVSLIWVLLMLAYTYIYNEFVLVKINAGITFVFTVVVYSTGRRKEDSGSRLVILGILISLGSIVVHSLKLSLHEWFNYKDLSHVFMITSLYFMYKGFRLNGESESLWVPVPVVT